MNLIDKFSVLFNASFPDRLPGLGDEDLLKLRTEISRLDSVSVKRVLPAVLLDILRKSEKDYRDDMIIYFLDGLKRQERNIEVRSILQKSSREVFDSFTKKQNSAVLEWLEAVSDKEFLEVCQDDYRSAVEYWRQRVGQ